MALHLNKEKIYVDLCDRIGTPTFNHVYYLQDMCLGLE